MTDPASWQPQSPPPGYPAPQGPPPPGYPAPQGHPPPRYGPPPGYQQPYTPPPKRSKAGLVAVVVVVVVVLLGAGIGGAVWLWPGGGSDPDVTAAPAVATPEYGLAFGPAGKNTVDVYLDFLCPACKSWDDKNGQTLKGMAAAGNSRVIVHPVAILNRMSTSEYSTRAAAAAACASDETRWFEFAETLWLNQPQEHTEHPGDDKLIALGRAVGLGDTFATCVSEGRYLAWVAAATKAAQLSAVPTIRLNGAELSPSADLAAELAKLG